MTVFSDPSFGKRLGVEEAKEKIKAAFIAGHELGFESGTEYGENKALNICAGPGSPDEYKAAEEYAETHHLPGEPDGRPK